jgi:hypothetical protein
LRTEVRPVLKPGFFVNHSATRLQKLQCARFFGVGLQRPDLVSVTQEVIQQEFGVARVVNCAWNCGWTGLWQPGIRAHTLTSHRVHHASRMPRPHCYAAARP